MSERGANQNSLATELQVLLRPLANNKAPELSILAAASMPTDAKRRSNSDSEGNGLIFMHIESDQLRLFERHVGPYQEVLGNALMHTRNLRSDEIFEFESDVDEPVSGERFEHPINRLIQGPRPDLCVWVGLFLGRDAEQRARAQFEENREEGEPCYGNVLTDIEQAASGLSILQLLRNILKYLSEEARRLGDAAKMLRFCALYGLSGAMSDVLDGKYGAVGQQGTVLTIDTALPAKSDDDYTDDDDDDYDDDYDFLYGSLLSMPAYSFGVTLGYCNVVRQAITCCGANIDAKFYLKDGPFEPREFDGLPAQMLLWAIKRNQLEMVKCLVRDFGFQFRWLATSTFEELYDLLFHIDAVNDEYGPWRGLQYDSERCMFVLSVQRKYRAYGCYQRKQAMLKALIEVGLPQELLLPQLDLTRDKEVWSQVQARGGDGSSDTSQEYLKSLSRVERRAREKVFTATAEANEHRKEMDELTYIAFYEDHAQSLWENQPTVQATRLSKKEDFDPRWKEYEEKGEDAFLPWWACKSEYDDTDSDMEDTDYY